MPGLLTSRSTAVAWLLVALVSSSCSRKLTDPMAPRAIDPGLSTTGIENAGVPGPVVVMVEPGTDPMDVVGNIGGEVLECQSALGLVSVRVDPAATAEDVVLAFAQDARVLAVEPERAFESAETRQRSFAFDDGLGSSTTYAEQPAAGVLGLTHAHQVSQGDDVVVAILDTGADLAHPALSGSILGGWDFVGRDSDPREETNGVDDDGDGDADEAYGHGTHVAGIVHLTAPDARLLIVRVLDSDGRGSLLHVAAGVRWAVRQGAQVINLSLGSLGHSAALDRALAEAEAAGVVVVVSAGNWGDFTPVEFPASSSHVIAVAAVDASRTPADFTSRGDFVALSAPGVGVRSTFPGGGYLLWSGTSMSAPFVAGTAALVFASNPDLTRLEVRQRMLWTSVLIPGAPTNGMGAGCLDAATAVAPTITIEEPDPEEFRPR